VNDLRPSFARKAPRRRGFTMMEAALATVIVGTAVVAAAELFGTCAKQNIHASHSTVAMMLANNVQEAMANAAFSDPQTGRAVYGAEGGETLAGYDDLDDFDNRTFNPPIDARRVSIPEMSQYSQVVTVRPVLSEQLSSNSNDASPTIATSTYTGAARVRVRVFYRATPTSQAQEVYTRSWIRPDR
jgi:type II secretory pathway pseudopilin PulG